MMVKETEQELSLSHTCKHCRKKFKFASQKKRHEESHVSNFTCKICWKTFNFISALRRHERQHNRKGPAHCEQCNKQFKDETLLKRHMSYAHKGTYSCTKCLATFNSEIALATHVKVHKPVEERRYHCSFKGCSKSFNFSHHLVHHELRHAGCKQHFCDICDKGFIQYHHYKSHMKTHDPDSWLQCTREGCLKRFATEYALKRHMATHVKANTRKQQEIAETTRSENTKTNSKITITNDENDSDEVAETNAHAHNESREVLNKDINEDVTEGTDVKAYNIVQVDVINKDEDLLLDWRIDDENDCHDAVGGCLATGSEMTDDCPCAQMSMKNADLKKDTLKITSTDVPPKTEVAKKIDIKSLKDIPKDNPCDNCESSSICKEMFKNNNNKDPQICSKIRQLPKLVCSADGVIKLEETFDCDIITELNPKIAPVKAVLKKDVANSNVKEIAVLMNSCKDVLGSCMVSGNDIMGEGCLCARMSMETQQITEQEIEEISICPRSGQ